MKQSTKMRRERTEEQVLAGEGVTCVICAGLMDGTDQKFKPCRCGFRLCVWCFHKIREEAAENSSKAKCPGCRREYNEQILRMKVDLKKSSQTPSRKHLESLLVVQRRAVRLTGVTKKFAKEDTLRTFAYLGQYGDISNITITAHAATSEVHVTFLNTSDASKAIGHIDGCSVDGHIVRASHTLHRYCPAFIRGVTCNVKSCPYLHNLAAEEDHVPKGDQQSLKPALQLGKGVQRKQGFPPVAKAKPQPPAQKGVAAAPGGGAKPAVSLLPANSTWGGTRNLPGQPAAKPEPAPEPTPAASQAPAPSPAPAAKGVKTKQHTSWASAAAVTVMSVSGGKRAPKATPARQVEEGEKEVDAKAEKEKEEARRREQERALEKVAAELKELPEAEFAGREALGKERTADFKVIIQQWIALMTRQQEKEEKALPAAPAAAPAAPAPVAPRARYVPPSTRKDTMLTEEKEAADDSHAAVGSSRLAKWQAAPAFQAPVEVKQAPAKSEQTSDNGLNPMAQGWTPGQGFAVAAQPEQPVPVTVMPQHPQPGVQVDIGAMGGAVHPLVSLQALQAQQVAMQQAALQQAALQQAAMQQAAMQQGFLLPVGTGLVQVNQAMAMQQQQHPSTMNPKRKQ